MQLNQVFTQQFIHKHPAFFAFPCHHVIIDVCGERKHRNKFEATVNHEIISKWLLVTDTLGGGGCELNGHCFVLLCHKCARHVSAQMCFYLQQIEQLDVTNLRFFIPTIQSSTRCDNSGLQIIWSLQDIMTYGCYKTCDFPYPLYSLIYALITSDFSSPGACRK